MLEKNKRKKLVEDSLTVLDDGHLTTIVGNKHSNRKASMLLEQ